MTLAYQIRLTLPEIRFAEEYQAMVRESIEIDGDYPYNNVPLALADFAAFVGELADEAAGIDLPPDIPAQQTYFLVFDDTKVIGEFRFRPQIEPPYERFNGHIGYNLRPAYRGKGIGTLALGLLLDIARERGLGGVQMTIDGENPASVRIIQKNGGYLEKAVVDAETEVVTLCYWVDL